MRAALRDAKIAAAKAEGRVKPSTTLARIPANDGLVSDLVLTLWCSPTDGIVAEGL